MQSSRPTWSCMMRIYGYGLRLKERILQLQVPCVRTSSRQQSQWGGARGGFNYILTRDGLLEMNWETQNFLRPIIMEGKELLAINEKRELLIAWARERAWKWSQKPTFEYSACLVWT